MGKGRDKQGREAKKKKKVKLPGGPPPADVQFRHHEVVTSSPSHSQSRPSKTPAGG